MSAAPGRRSTSARSARRSTSGPRKPVVIGQVEGVRVAGALVEPEQLTAYPVICPLTVTKLVDPTGQRQSGDIVTITIRYANTGAKAISDLVVSDSLSGRLEYIVGSAETDRPGNFTSAENEAGSVVVSLGPARHAAAGAGRHDAVQGEGAVMRKGMWPPRGGARRESRPISVGNSAKVAVFFLQCPLLDQAHIVKLCRVRPFAACGVDRGAPGTGHDCPRSVP